ncbi:MAG TPA: YdcF family protein [Paraburkholderia sp.]|nr:YdcF family protein [Paraburkholderia sp.]
MIWRRGRRKVAVCTLGIFWLLSSGWLTIALLDLAQPAIYRIPYDYTKPGLAKIDSQTAIVVLGGGTEHDGDGRLVPKHDVYARLTAAAALYAQCTREAARCRVIVSGGNPQHHEATEADTYAPYLLRLRVPPSDLVLENSSLTTWQNARNVARVIGGRHDETVLLVTSAYHMRRAMLDFRRFGLDPVPVVSSVRRARTGWLPRLDNLGAAEIALHELIGTAQFYVYRMLGWF